MMMGSPVAGRTISDREEMPGDHGSQTVDHGTHDVRLPGAGSFLIGSIGAVVLVHVSQMQVVRKPLADQDR